MTSRPNEEEDKKRSLCTRQLKCNTCSTIKNKDFNSARNMCAITESHTIGNGRPEYLTLSVENSKITTEYQMTAKYGILYLII